MISRGPFQSLPFFVWFILFPHMHCDLYREHSSRLGVCVCNRFLNTGASSNRSLFPCQYKEGDVEAFGLPKSWPRPGDRVTADFSAFLREPAFKQKHIKGKFLSLLPQVIPWCSISWIFFLVIQDDFALGQPADMMNLMCSTQCVHNKALAVPQVDNTHYGLRHCCHLLVWPGRKSKTLQFFPSDDFNYFNDLGTMCLDEPWDP